MLGAGWEPPRELGGCVYTGGVAELVWEEGLTKAASLRRQWFS